MKTNKRAIRCMKVSREIFKDMESSKEKFWRSLSDRLK